MPCVIYVFKQVFVSVAIDAADEVVVPIVIEYNGSSCVIGDAGYIVSGVCEIQAAGLIRHPGKPTCGVGECRTASVFSRFFIILPKENNTYIKYHSNEMFKKIDQTTLHT